MERPYITIKQAFFDNILRVREDLKSHFEQAHSFMTWIVGFSVGGLALVLTNLDKKGLALNHGQTKAIMMLFTFSIVMGIVYRMAINAYKAKFNDAILFLEGAFSTKEMMAMTPTDIGGENDIRKLILFLKADYGEDLNHLIPLYDQGNDAQRNILLEHVKSHYQLTAEWVARDVAIAIDYANATNKKAFGLSDSDIRKLNREYSSKALNRWKWIMVIAFYSSCISFVAVSVIICIVY